MWYLRAAEAGDAEAQIMLDYFYGFDDSNGGWRVGEGAAAFTLYIA